MAEYSYKASRAGAGIIDNFAPYKATVRQIDQTATELPKHYGLAMFIGSIVGENVILPESGTAISDFEGVLSYSTRNERKYKNELQEVEIAYNDINTILQWGTVGVRVADDATPEYNDKVYIITSGDDVGKFTNDDAGNLELETAKFITTNEDGIAVIEIYGGIL
jgi:hypothetical protein